ncbi:MAG: TrmH family RNA methyltransferase [bacterium]|nr:TrmH family RNA methyltransferase [bacterium]
MGALVVVLDNIRSTANVGVILRTAVAFGFDRAILVGTTPTPDRKEVRKAALGGENITWQYVTTLQLPLDLPRPIIALETGGTDIWQGRAELAPLKTGTIIIGSERGGLSPELLKKCDWHLTINHQRQTIKSLNVATALAIAAAVLT